MTTRSLKNFTETELKSQITQKRQDLKNAGKEGAGFHRNNGDFGRISFEVLMLRAELVDRGALPT